MSSNDKTKICCNINYYSLDSRYIIPKKAVIELKPSSLKWLITFIKSSRTLQLDSFLYEAYRLVQKFIHVGCICSFHKIILFFTQNQISIQWKVGNFCFRITIQFFPSVFISRPSVFVLVSGQPFIPSSNSNSSISFT